MQLPALRDGLRGLYNRRYLEDVFSRELHRVERNGKPVSVVMIDIDHFKRFNDKRVTTRVTSCSVRWHAPSRTISAPPTPPAAMAAKSLPSVGAGFASPGNRLRLAPDRDSTATQRHAPSLTPR